MTPPMNRRSFLAASVAAAIAAACGDDDTDIATSGQPSDTDGAPGDSTTSGPEASSSTFAPPTSGTRAPDLAGDPFTLGVASGDPTADSVILWTRLAVDPQADGGGMGIDDDIEVAYAVATDEAMADIVDEGTATAIAALGHSVHLDASGLEPDTTYYYRFELAAFESQVGRTRTLAEAGSVPDALRFAFSSCQNWEAGEYAAYRHMVETDDIDLMIFLGDYIYEYATGGYAEDGATRQVQDFETENLEQYRQRYALYKSDEHLQAAHAWVPWIVTWDDHEVDNDYASAVSEQGDAEAAFLERRAAAYQAWYEHMPVRLDPPDGPDYPIYRAASHGDLVNFHVLDTRQYRADQQTSEPFLEAVGAALQERNDALAFLPEQTMLGDEQEEWLLDSTQSSSAVWDVLAQQVFMFGANILAGTAPPIVVVDTWDGYAGARQRLVEEVAGAVDNLVVLSGDFHSAAVGDLRADPFDTSLPVVGSEFMAGPISSSFFDDDDTIAGLVEGVLAGNEQIKKFDPRRGYMHCTVTPERWTTEIRVVTDHFDPESPVETASRWEITAGTPGAVEV